MNPYQPSPLPTAQVELPPGLQGLLEQIARNVHENWALARSQEGWVWGAQRNDGLRQHPCLVPYSDLPESEKDYDRLTAEQTLKAILTMGFRILPPEPGAASPGATTQLVQAPAPSVPGAQKNRVGDFIGKYQLLGLLGAGGLGEVWHARDTGITQREVAIKTILVSGEHFQLDSLRSEAQVMARMYHHPNLPVLYDVLEVPGGFVLVVEYLPGYDLDCFLQHAQGFISWSDLRAIMQGILAGLEHAQRYDVLHRDLKPRNIRIFNPLPRYRAVQVKDVKILDFGLGILWKEWNKQVADDWTATFAPFAGTPRYMSPEQIRGGPLSTASDLYAVGLILFELLTGHWPYEVPETPTIRSFFDAHCDQAPRDPRRWRPDLPEELIPVLDRCLSKDPGQRYSRAEELRGVLMPLLADLEARFPGTTLCDFSDQGVPGDQQAGGDADQATRSLEQLRNRKG